MKKKTYRKTIRINGEEVKSPRFSTHSDAIRWYNSKQKEKLYQKEGLHAPIDRTVNLSDYFDRVWFPKRKEKYPASTFKADIQRFNKYIRPGIGKMTIARINQLQIRKVLSDVVDQHKSSIQTRNRVRSLCSKLFNDAMNENPPLRSDNPALNISFDDPRQGKKVPVHIARQQDIVSFLKHARELGPNHLVMASVCLMSGIRRGELLGLKWGDVNWDSADVMICRRFMSATWSVVPGLKGGKDDSRVVAVPDDLLKLLERHRRLSDFKGEDDFILSTEDGQNMTPRHAWDMLESIRSASGVHTTIHGLRHTYGRQFVLNGGSLKVLQAILGHTSSSTTEIYSRLAGKTVNKFRNTVTFNVDGDDDES